jgi:threonine dehydrogenase-like Zn-dependent dehydrogenase
MELRVLDRPSVGPSEALVRVEAAGICGTDIHMYYDGAGAIGFPPIRGHEPVGTVIEIGDVLRHRLGLEVGDRVAIDPFIRCGACRFCLAGKGELCEGAAEEHYNYANIPLSEGTGLWGGFATHLTLTDRTAVYKVPPEVDPIKASLFNAMGAAVKWTIDVGGVRLGSTVVVLGGGQRGLCCAVAALEAGASFVAVTGLERDAHKLQLAEELGVSLAVNIERTDLVPAIAEAVPGGVDVVVDTTPGSNQAVTDALEMVRTGGRIVVAGIKRTPHDAFPFDDLIKKEITICGVLGTGADHYRTAVALLATSTRPLERMQTHVLPLTDVVRGIGLLAGREPDEKPIAVVIETS